MFMSQNNLQRNQRTSFLFSKTENFWSIQISRNMPYTKGRKTRLKTNCSQSMFLNIMSVAIRFLMTCDSFLCCFS